MLDNPRSDRVRAVAVLATANGRRRQGRFLVEGVRAVVDLLDAVTDGTWRSRVHAVYADPDTLERHPGLDRLAGAAQVPVHPASAAVIAAMADTGTPQGVVAVAEVPVTGLDDVGPPAGGFAVQLVEVRDPGNVGTVVRAADAAGASGVVLTPGCADLYSPKAVRSTVGSLFHLPIAVDAPAALTLPRWSAAGVSVLATAADGELSLDDVTDAARTGRGPLAGPHVWLLGSEAHGLPPEVTAAVDAVVRIPLRGRAESLNVAMAATLVLFASGQTVRTTSGSGS